MMTPAPGQAGNTFQAALAPESESDQNVRCAESEDGVCWPAATKTVSPISEPDRYAAVCGSGASSSMVVSPPRSRIR